MRVTLSSLDDDQADAIRAVALLYLSETRWALKASPMFPAEHRAEILRRREACSLIVEARTAS